MILNMPTSPQCLALPFSMPATARRRPQICCHQAPHEARLLTCHLPQLVTILSSTRDCPWTRGRPTQQARAPDKAQATHFVQETALMIVRAAHRCPIDRQKFRDSFNQHSKTICLRQTSNTFAARGKRRMVCRQARVRVGGHRERQSRTKARRPSFRK